PWMGGFYERLVGLVKRALRKTINGQLITYRQLETVVIETEALINSRPLGFIGTDLDGGEILTPAMFLGTTHRAGIPNLEVDDADPSFSVGSDSVELLIKKWKCHQKLLDSFWAKFRDEYLLGLRER